MPFDFGIGEIAIVLVIGLLVFGPKKLPEISKGLGSGMRDFRRGLAGEADPVPAPAATEAPVVQTAAPVAAETVAVAAEAPVEAPAPAAPVTTPAPPAE